MRRRRVRRIRRQTLSRDFTGEADGRDIEGSGVEGCSNPKENKVHHLHVLHHGLHHWRNRECAAGDLPIKDVEFRAAASVTELRSELKKMEELLADPQEHQTPSFLDAMRRGLAEGYELYLYINKIDATKDEETTSRSKIKKLEDGKGTVVHQASEPANT